MKNILLVAAALTMIAAGAPDDGASVAEVVSLRVTPSQAIVDDLETPVALRVTATSADGESRDVTRWAVYEPSRPIVQISEDGVVRGTMRGEVTIAVRYLGQQAPVRLAMISRSTEPSTRYSTLSRAAASCRFRGGTLNMNDEVLDRTSRPSMTDRLRMISSVSPSTKYSPE